MNKSTTAFASLIVATSFAGGAALTAQAHSSQLSARPESYQTSHVAATRLHALLQTQSTGNSRSINPNDGGSTHD